jgi:DnaK suppressor protein
MARKDVLLRLRHILIKRRDALRKALAGDLSLLKELNQQSGGDAADFARDAAHDEISSRLAEVERWKLSGSGMIPGNWGKVGSGWLAQPL